MYQQITLAQFRQRLIEQLGGAATIFWRTAELNGIIQESLRVWNSLTGYWRTRQLITTVADQHWYTVAGSVTSTLRVAFAGQPLVPISLTDLDSGQQYWESENTSSGDTVPAVPMMFAIGALNLIAIWPADHAGNNQLQVDGLAVTPVLTTDNSYIDIGTEDLNALLDYCEHVALFKEGGAEFSSTLPSDENPNALFASFMQAAAQRSGMLSRSELYRQWMGGDVNERQKNPLRRVSKAGAR